MRIINRRLRETTPWALVALLTLAPLAAVKAAELPAQEGYTLVRLLMSGNKKDRKSAAQELIAADDTSLVPAIVDAFFYTPHLFRPEMTKVLEALTGEKHSSYYDWVEYVGREKIEPKERYVEWKLLLLQKQDPDYAKVLYPGAPAKIRLDEVISGGVTIDGIPSLDSPPVMAGAEAKFMRKDERVFGVEINGQSRAYPHRFLSWHEMLNDVVGGEPVTLSFCTLCGSGILYSGKAEAGTVRTFGTSGLLYRSNKLMYDRQTYTLWSNITGEAVVGRLAGGDLKLDVLPMTVTTWEEWLQSHPDTEVLDLKEVERSLAHLPYKFPYKPGAADTARRGVEFPVWQKNDRLDRNTEIFALQINGAAKAYPLARVDQLGVINDELGGESLVLVGHPESGAVRAYAGGGLTFRRGEASDQVVDESGGVWRVTEAALEPEAAGEPLARLAQGHNAYWFGWVGFYPQTQVYGD
jgi:hypothetical protein